MRRSIGMSIRDARKRANLTQSELGAVIGSSASSVCELERGERKAPISPEEIISLADGVKDVHLMHEFCDACPIRRRILIRKFPPLNNLLTSPHISIIKTSQKLAETSESLSVMLPKMLRVGFQKDPDFLEYRNSTIIKLLNLKRVLETVFDQLQENDILPPEDLRMLIDEEQRECEAKGYHVPGRECE